MAKTFKLELLAADRPFFVGECEHLIYPAQDGLVGVLPGHIWVLCPAGANFGA